MNAHRKRSSRFPSCPEDGRRLTQNAHVVLPLLLVFLDQVVEVVGEVLEQRVLLVNLQAQDAVEELGDAAV